jgi:hypothetical protein
VAVTLAGEDLLRWIPLAISLVALFVSVAATVVPYWRRPKLSLLADRERTHSRVEGDGLPYLRLLVHNAKRKRSAKQARVVLDGYREAGAKRPLTRLGSPFLGWPSIFGQGTDSYVAVVFSDTERPVGLGRFVRVRVDPDTGLREREVQYRQHFTDVPPPGPIRHFDDDVPDARWHLHLELADNATIADERDWLAPNSWTIRLIVGADDGDGSAYDVDVAWSGAEPDAHAVFGAVLDSLKVRSLRRGR